VKSRGLLRSRLFVDHYTSDAEIFEAPSGQLAVYTAAAEDDAANEDAVGLFPCTEETTVLAVADGVGGQRAGEQAAHIALMQLRAALNRIRRESAEPRAAILDGFEQANRAVLEMGIGAATTLAVVEVCGKQIRPYHVGDSPILVVGQRGQVKLQSVAHSPVGYAVESGLVDEDDALNHEERHVVSNLIGDQEMRIEMGSTMTLARYDTLLIASDGLWDNLYLSEIVENVRKGPMEQVVRGLVGTCRSRMHGDGEGQPSKLDDVSFVVYRPARGRRSVKS